MTKELITINRGYKVIEKETILDAVSAYKILSTNKQFKYTKAEYLMDLKQVKLTRHICICPNCNSYIPAYTHAFFEWQPRRKMSASQAKSWCYELRPFFDTENDTFDFYKPFESVEELSCPYCNRKSGFSSHKNNISIEYDKGIITVSCELKWILDVVNIDWAPSIKMSELPLTESVIFNVKKGKTFFTLTNDAGDLIAIQDVTNGLPSSKQKSILIEFINNNVHIKKALSRNFERAWGKALPYPFVELDINKCILLTSYVGYDNVTFYDNIPTASKDNTFDTTFNTSRKHLHYAEFCVDLLANSEIPQSKSIKTYIYQNPYLLFFIKEIEAFWKLFGEDYNLLLSFLQSETACANLFALHTYPGIEDFYSDFVRIKSSYELNKILTLSGKEPCVYGIYYSALSKQNKAEAQKTWKRLKGFMKYCYLYSPFSDMMDKLFLTLPSAKLSERFFPKQVNGYQFAALKSRHDFVTAGEQLGNCLGKVSFENPVIGVKKAGRYVAAIEVDLEEKIIIQARIAENNSIENDANIFKAYKKWCKKNGIVYDEAPTHAF